MKKEIYIYIITLTLTLITARSEVIEICSSCTYRTVSSAVSAVKPGDTLLLSDNIYSGGEYIENLKGQPGGYITIIAKNGVPATFRGGGNAFQFSEAAFILIKNIIFERQTANGVNVDDGGTYETPTHHIIFDSCTFRDMNATGNNDLLKLSGVDSFIVRNCVFSKGSAGGSGIDMVGCHDGIIRGNSFVEQGSNSIQAKGGSKNLLIEQNLFSNGGQRAINIGGSTGLPYFRPLDAIFEASDILVYSNIFLYSLAPIAYVGAVNCEVVNNTLWLPDKWAVRILQETTDSRFLKCGNNKFINNIVFINTKAANATINIGPNTQPETFIFSNNLWFNTDNAGWQGPNLPVTETNGIIGQNPIFTDTLIKNFRLKVNSPAIGKGLNVIKPEFDFEGKKFYLPRSIGSFEQGNFENINFELNTDMQFNVFPNPATDYIEISFSPSIMRGPGGGSEINILNSLGDCVVDLTPSPSPRGEGRIMKVDVSDLAAGMYFVKSGSRIQKFVKY